MSSEAQKPERMAIDDPEIVDVRSIHHRTIKAVRRGNWRNFRRFVKILGGYMIFYRGCLKEVGEDLYPERSNARYPLGTLAKFPRKYPKICGSNPRKEREYQQAKEES